MKVTCEREKLREGLAIANQVTPAKSTKPVLENVCLVATDNALEIIGTDQEVSLRFRIEDVEVAEPGPAVIPARVALDFVRDLTSETCTLESTDTTQLLALRVAKRALEDAGPEGEGVDRSPAGRGGG